MPNRYEPTDIRLLRDLWHATKPESGEHRLSFTVKLTPKGSYSLRRRDGGFITAALKLVRDNLSVEKPKDIVVVVERDKKTSSAYNGSTVGLHIHGFLRISKSVSAVELQTRMNKRAKHRSNIKIRRERGWDFSEVNPKTGKAVDVGWSKYIAKHFDRWPTGCKAASRRFSATQPTKTRARVQGKRRRDTFRSLKREFAKVDRQIQRRQGEWKYWHLAYDPSEEPYPEHNQYPRYRE